MTGSCNRSSRPLADIETPGRCAGMRRARGLVDRFVGDPHRLIIREVELDPTGDLFWAPRPRPAPILPPSMATTDPGHLRTGHRAAVGTDDRPGEPVLHIEPQRVVGGELCPLWTPGLPIGMPLRGRGPMVQGSATGRSVAAQVALDRRRRPAQPAGDLPHPAVAGSRSPGPTIPLRAG
jgi:hypothetical protein